MYQYQKYFVLILSLLLLGPVACSGGDSGSSTSGSSGSGSSSGSAPLSLSFATPSSFDAGLAVPSKAQNVLAADFDNDGKMDVAISFDSGISIFLGKGDGTFQPKFALPTGAGPTALTIGLFNAGNTLDLAASTGNNDVAFLKNNNGSSFDPLVAVGTGTSPEGAAAGDFDGDGKLDVAVSIASDNSLDILFGDGNLAFTRVNYPSGAKLSGPRNLVAADFNKDGKADLAFANFAGDNVTVWTNSGSTTRSLLFPSGNAKNLTLPAGATAQGVHAADFNSDTLPDIAVPNPGTKNVSVFLNQGSGNFAAATLYPAGTDPFSVSSGDFNKDNKLDLVVVNTFGVDGVHGDFNIYLGNGDGTFQTAKTFTVGNNTIAPIVPNGPRSVAVADFNGDTLPDVVTANSPGDSMTLILNTSK